MTWSEVQEGAAFGLTVVGLLVIFGPLIAEKLRLPGLLGLLVGGALIGPNMLDVLPSIGTLEAVGEIGVLYLIFLAGLQLDIESFVRFFRISAGFGLLTAFIPFALGIATARSLDIGWSASILIGSFWASFTLITYPTVSRYGLTRNRAVAAIVGASSITDTISLVVLALVIGSETGDAGGFELLAEIALGFAILAAWCFIVVPRIARWFFLGLGYERTLRYMLLLIALTSSAVVADLVGIEPLIGAFFVGVGLNRLVPNAAPLMTVTDFFGNAFFIPTFIVSVGLLFDPEVMFTRDTMRMAISFAAALFAGKTIAAWVSGRIFRLERAEVGLMLSMSVAQAAATLAATIVGLEAGLYESDVVNAVMVVVALSLVATSVGTNLYAPRVFAPHAERPRLGTAVLLPAGEPGEGLEPTARLARQLTSEVSGIVQPLVITTSTDPDAMAHARERKRDVDEAVARLGLDAETRIRLDRSIATALNRAALESESSMLLLPWTRRDRLRGWLVGSDYQEIVSATALPVAIAAVHDPPYGTIALFAGDDDLAPGQLPSLRLAAELATGLLTDEHLLKLGPATREALVAREVLLPSAVVSCPEPRRLIDWALANTESGDVVVLSFVDLSLRSAAIDLFETGRSVVAITHNAESASRLQRSTMSVPVGGSMAPV